MRCFPSDENSIKNEFTNSPSATYLAMTRHFLSVALLLTAVFSGFSSAADFPPVSELKPQAGLPDPLVMLSGQKVQSKEQWEKERRPELKALFQHYMYGYLPPKPDKVFEDGESWSEAG